MTTSKPAPSPKSLASHARVTRSVACFGYAALALFAGSVGVWSATASISGAVIAPAQFVADTNLKKVQHQTGGVVGELKVREGDRVREGDLLIRLDDTLPRANLAIVQSQLDEYAARSARLEAERDGREEPSFPLALTQRVGDPQIARLMMDEARLSVVRAKARAGMRSQLQQRIGQLHSEIEGLTEQRLAKVHEAELIQRELTGVRELFRQNLVQISRLSQLEREAASLAGQRGQLTAQIAQAKGRMAEIELQILQVDEDLRAEAVKELRELQARTTEANERRVAAEDQLKRVDIRAPSAGVVHQLAVHTVGGVITPAEPAMLIVPSAELLFLEARVAPADIDQLRLGQSTVVRLHAFNQRTTPELTGSVARIGADVVREPQTGLTYYSVRIALAASETARIAPLTIVAGMQADAYVETASRSPFAYLVRPVKDQFAKAFRER